jgi:diguanylate cyclase (GGDEF)-like protein
VVALDIDDFHDLDRLLGRQLSDQVLVVLAARIEACLRDTDVIARLDVDEFVIVCEDVRDPGDVERIERRIVDAVTVPMEVGDHAVELRVTAAHATSSGGDRAEDLLARVDDLVLAAKPIYLR